MSSLTLTPGFSAPPQKATRSPSDLLVAAICGGAFGLTYIADVVAVVAYWLS